MERLMKLRNFVVAGLFCGLATNANAGNSGGGGNAVVCRDSAKKIVSAELLDLFEGRQEMNLTYTAKPADTIKDRLQMAVDKFKATVQGPTNPTLGFFQSEPYWYYDDGTAWSLISVPHYLDHFDEKFTVLPENVKLAPLDDSFEVVLPKDCAVERLALYKDSLGKVLIDGEIWKNLNSLNRAALVFHEASYYYDRKMNKAQDSRVTRHIVGMMFADQTVPSLFKGLENKKIVCQKALFTEASGIDMQKYWTEVMYSQDAQGNHYFNFGGFLGKQIYSQTMVKFTQPVDPNSFGNAEVIHSDVELSPMRLIKFPYKYVTYGNGQKALAQVPGSKKVVLWLLGEGSSYPDMKLELTDENGDMTCNGVSTNGQPNVVTVHLDRPN